MDRQPWTCPKCGRGLPPWVDSCDHAEWRGSTVAPTMIPPNKGDKVALTYQQEIGDI